MVSRMRLHVVGACLALLAPVAAAASQPHVAVILVDDLDVNTMWAMRRAGLLPNIEALASSGADFQRALVSNSVCAPSRATLMTGRYSGNNGVHCNAQACVGGASGSVEALDHSNTLVTWLQAAGYRTGHFGKWLNGYGQDAAAPPTSPRNPSYVPPGWTTWQATVDPTTYLSYGFRMNVDGVAVQYGTAPADHQTRVLADRASSWIVANRAAGPVFALVAPVAPHFTLDFRIGPTEGNYSDTWDSVILPDVRDATLHSSAWNASAGMFFWPSLKASFNRPSLVTGLARPVMRSVDVTQAATQYRLRMLSMIAVDDLVGQVVAAFGGAPAWIFFTSDNGYHFGEHALGAKMTAHDEATVVPLFVRGPGTVPGVRPDLVLNNDLAPTIAELAGAVPGLEVDGRSLLPLLTGSPVAWRRRVLVQHWHIPELGLIYDFPRYDAVRTGPSDGLPRRLYVEWPETGECELFDGNTDPWQIDNLCGDAAHAAEVEALSAVLARLRGCHGDLCRAAEDDPLASVAFLKTR